MRLLSLRRGVFQSTNSGASWSPVNTGLSGGALYVYALAIDPHTPSTLYAGTGSGVFQSTNSGGSWSAVNTAARAAIPSTSTRWPSTRTRRARSTPGPLITGSSKAPTAAAVGVRLTPAYLSTGASGHWPSTHTPRARSTRGPAGDGVYRSTNSGASWSAVNSGLTDPSGNPLNVYALAIDPHTPSTLYAGTDAGVFDIELTCVVGTGTSASCTESALDACLPGGAGFNGTVTFNCGGAATITVTSTKTISADTTIDGGSLITISGGHSVGVFSVNTGVNVHGPEPDHRQRQ